MKRILFIIVACALAGAQSHQIIKHHAAVATPQFAFVDMSSTAALTGCTEVTNTVTCTTATTPVNGKSISISGVTPSGYNGAYTVASVTAGVSFTYTDSTGSLGTGTGGSWIQGPTNVTCATATTCIVTMPTATAAQALLVAVFGTTTTLGRHITNVACSDGSHTEGNFQPLDGSITATDSTRGNVDIAYLLSSLGGCTQFTFTFSASSGTPFIGILEATYTSPGMASLDGACGESDNTVATTTQAGIGFTLTGTSDFMVQQIKKAAGATAINESYVLPVSFVYSLPTSLIWTPAYLLNSSTGTAPTWTIGNSTSVTDGCAFSPPIIHNTRVQGASQTVTSGSNVLAYSSNVTAGDILTANVLNSSAVSTISSSGTATLGTWTPICANGNASCAGNASADAAGNVHDISGGGIGYMNMWYSVVSGSGTATVTVTNTGNTTVDLVLGEWLSPTGTYDVSATSNGNSAFNATPATPATAAVAGAGELIVGQCVDSGTGYTYTPTGSFQTNDPAAKLIRQQVMYDLSSPKGTQIGSANLSATGNWMCMVGAFK